MSLLPDNYWDTPAPAASPTPAPAPQPDAQPPAPAEQASLDLFGQEPSNTIPATSSASTPAVAPKSYGVGLSYLIPQALGFGLPDPDTFENMSTGDKALAYGAGLVNATKKLVSGAVSVPIQSLGSLAATGVEATRGIYAGAKESFAQGKLVSPEQALADEAAPNLGGTKEDFHTDFNMGPFGDAPSWFKTYDDSIHSGAGPLATSLMTFGKATGDMTVAGGIGEGLGASMAPKRNIAEGLDVSNVAPVRQAITSDTGKVKFSQKEDSVNEYYNVTNEFAKQYDGNKSNIKIKLSPVGDGTMQASVVKIGAKGTADSDFVGQKETPLFTQNKIPLAPQAGGMVPLTPEEMQARGLPGENGNVQSTLEIPKAAPKGQEDAPITQDQLGQLDLISKVNGIEPGVKQTVMNAITGKDAVGDLTQGEYVRFAQSLGLLDKAAQYSPTMSLVNRVADGLSPRHSFFTSVEQRTGVPVASQLEIPMENAQRAMKIYTETQDAIIKEQYGKYWSDPDAGRLVRSYLTGDQDAILKNPDLTPEQKTDLVDIANARADWYDKQGEVLGVNRDIYLKNYAPHVRNLGGVYQLYKEGAEMPGASTFFATQKRTGGLTPLIDDERALGGIYNHAGARTKFMGPAIEKAAAVYEGAPANLKGSIKSYVLTKMGYEGATEEMLNGVVDHMNQKFGWNLAPDTARKMTQLTMDTTYAAAMGFNPGTYLRNLISNPTFTFAENGAQYLPESIAEYFKNPSAANAELRSRGFSVQSANPYGDAIANEDTNFGRIATKYRNLTEFTMRGMNLSDSFGRYVTMKQSDSIFNNAIASYNAGKITWPQVETSLDFDGMSIPDRNEIRQQIVKGSVADARDHFARVKIDATQFPYRTGTMGRAMNGVAGKVGFQFSSYTNNYLHMVGRWVKYGQWDKLIRFIGSQAVVYRTLSNQFGLNYSNSLGVNPAIPSVSPFVKTGADLYGMLQGVRDKSAQDIENNKDDIVNEARSLGFPGVEGNRVQSFLQSYNKGPNSQGLYPVYSSNGKMSRSATFSDLFWTAFGFPTNQAVANQGLVGDEINSSYNYTNTQQQILQLIGAGKGDQATQLMKSSGVTVSSDAINSYLQAQNIPLSLRLFEQLPKPLQAEFAPKVFQNSK